MDELARCHYELRYEVTYLKAKGDEFQGFFASIMEKRYPADFIRVRPWGNVGDRKNDGYLKSKRTLFQCYAPNEMEAAACLKKINEDFDGALPHWKQYFDVWSFVHNSQIGLGPQVTAKLLELGTAHAPLVVIHWGFEELRNEVMQLGAQELSSLFGAAPSRQGMVDLGLEDLVPVLDHISRLPPDDPDLRPVPPDKLQKNMLSDHVASLLRAGMSRAEVVRKYFKLKPTQQDQIAESFRKEYARLRNSGATPDNIFAGLQQFAAGNRVAPPNVQNAVLATLAFFFEECDIFERTGAEGSK